MGRYHPSAAKKRATPCERVPYDVVPAVKTTVPGREFYPETSGLFERPMPRSPNWITWRPADAVFLASCGVPRLLPRRKPPTTALGQTFSLPVCRTPKLRYCSAVVLEYRDIVISSFGHEPLIWQFQDPQCYPAILQYRSIDLLQYPNTVIQGQLGLQTTRIVGSNRIQLEPLSGSIILVEVGAGRAGGHFLGA